MTFPELFQAIEERRELMVHASERVDGSTELLGEVDNDIEELLHFPDLFDHRDTHKVFEHYSDVLEKFPKWEDETSVQLETDHTKTRHTLAEAHETLDHGFEYVQEKHRQIQEKILEGEIYLLRYEELVDQLTFELSMTFADLADQASELSHRIQMLALDTEAGIVEFHDSLVNDSIATLEQTFGETRDMLDGLSRSRLPAASKQFVGTLDEVFQEINEFTAGQGEKLSIAFEDSAVRLDDFVRGDVMNALVDMFTQLDRKALDGMAETMGQTAQIMAGGSHITSAITKWLPTLKRIRETVDTVQELAASE